MKVSAQLESWPIARPFTISRGTKRTAEVVVATVTDREFSGRGECVPYARYGETTQHVVRTIKDYRGPFDRDEMANILPAGAARNALDCALWDLAAKRSGQAAWKLAGVSRPNDVVTALSVSLDSPERMGERARAARERALLKVKLGADSVSLDIERLRVVQASAPDFAPDRGRQRRLVPRGPGDVHSGSARSRRRNDRAAAAGRGGCGSS